MNSKHLTVPAKPDCEHWLDHLAPWLRFNYRLLDEYHCQTLSRAFLHNWLNTPCVHGPLGGYSTNSHVTMSFIFCILMLWHLGVLDDSRRTTLHRVSKFLEINIFPSSMPFLCKPTNTESKLPITSLTGSHTQGHYPPSLNISEPSTKYLGPSLCPRALWNYPNSQS